MRLPRLFAFPFLLTSLAVAHADTLSTFNFQGSSIFYGMAGDTNTVSGSTTIDTATGKVQSLSFLANGQVYSGITSQVGAEVFVGPSDAAFSFSTASLIGYTGSTFNLNGANDLYVGSLTPATAPVSLVQATSIAITPEPASLLLISTGLLGCSLFLRRRHQPVTR